MRDVSTVVRPKNAQSERTHTYILNFSDSVGVENVEDNGEDVNQFEEMSLFTNPMN
jgi:hypothetical protein